MQKRKRWIITIPDWSEGKPIRFISVKNTQAEAVRQVIDFINARAGYQYCDKLPPGSTVQLDGQHTSRKANGRFPKGNRP